MGKRERRMLTALLFAAGSCVLAIPPLSHLSAIQTCEKHDLACGIDPGGTFLPVSVV